MFKEKINLQESIFLILGAQKAGTSSLFYYLNQHPLIHGGQQKEINFFNKDENYSLGKKRYLSHFNYQFINNKNLFFEATPEYLYYPKTAERIYQFHSKIKLIIILREPIQRAYSAWNMFRVMHHQVQELSSKNQEYKLNINKTLLLKLQNMRTYPTFEQAIKEDLERFDNHSTELEPSFVRRGIYLPQIKRYFDVFSQEQILILGYQDLIQKPIDNLNLILNFLGIPKSNWDFLNIEIKNKGVYENEIPKQAFDMLNQFYHNHNQELFNFLNNPINW